MPDAFKDKDAIKKKNAGSSPSCKMLVKISINELIVYSAVLGYVLGLLQNSTGDSKRDDVILQMLGFLLCADIKCLIRRNISHCCVSDVKQLPSYSLA